MNTLIETYRGTVAAWECDHYGHMNVQHYMGRISDAAGTLLHAIGLGAEDSKRLRLGFAALHQEIDYRRELLAGDPIVMQSGVAEAAGKKIRFRHRLLNAETGEVSMTASVFGVFLHLDQRRATAMPAEVEARAQAMAIGDADILPDGPVVILGPLNAPVASQRSCVNPWECDRMGHLNVQFYLARATDAEAHLLAALGLGPARLRREGFTPRALEHRTLFRRELHVGTVTSARSAVREIDGGRLHAVTELTNGETGALAAQIESVLALESGAGADVAWPTDVRAAARRLAAACATQIPALSPAEPAPPTAAMAGLVESGRGTVNTWEADAGGRMAPRFVMARFSDAAGQLLTRIGLGGETMRQRGWGSAALDYHIRYLRRLAAGDAFVIRSGVTEIGDKVWRFCHQVRELATDEVAATASVAALLFDLATRKSFPLPDEVRAKVEPFRIAAGG